MPQNKIEQFTTIGLFATCLFLPHLVSAEMNLCDGVWTNQACKGVEERRLGTTKELTPEEQALVAARSKKRSVLHELTMRSIEAKRDYGVDLSLEKAEQVCRDDSSTVDACREAADLLNERLAKRVTQELELVKAKRELEAKENPPAPPQHTAIVIQERPIYIDRYPHHYPHQYPGTHHSTQTAGGAAISIQGGSSSGNVSVGIGVGGSVSSTQNQHQITPLSPSPAAKPRSQTSPGRKEVREPFSANTFPSFR